MKILFYIESLRSGGKERRLVELIRGLKKYSDLEMELVLMSDDIHYYEVYETGIEIHKTIRTFGKKDPSVLWKFLKIAKSFKPDIINVWGNMVSLYAIPAKVFLKIPMVNNQITVAPLFVEGGLLSYKTSFPFSDAIVANSYAGLKSYNAPKEKSLVIYNGFDFNRNANLESQEVIRKQLHITTKYVIGMVASFSVYKDYETYIKAANLVLLERDDVSFLCVGSGNDNKYKEMVLDKNKEYVLFLGRRQNVENIMNICDIGVLTSNVKMHGEGISNALMEFSSLAKPTIATDNGGTPEIIENNLNGFLIEPFNEKQLAEKILYLLVNKEIRFNMGKEAKKVVESKFGIDRMIEEFYLLYKNNCKKVN